MLVYKLGYIHKQGFVNGRFILFLFFLFHIDLLLVVLLKAPLVMVYCSLNPTMPLHGK